MTLSSLLDVLELRVDQAHDYLRKGRIDDLVTTLYMIEGSVNELKREIFLRRPSGSGAVPPRSPCVGHAFEQE